MQIPSELILGARLAGKSVEQNKKWNDIAGSRIRTLDLQKIGDLRNC